MKKTLSLILALLMSASCAATIFADEATVTSAIEEEVTEEEVVVEAETEYDLAVKFLEYKKIMQGKGDGLLHVEDAVKRYEMAIFAGRIATGWVKSTDWENGTDDRTQFTDLEGSGAKDSYGILSYVAEKDIIKGYPDGTFKPEATVTYRDALAIVVRTLGYTGLEYPWGIIEKAVTLGLTEDITGVAYTDTINRGVAAQIMYNALFNAVTAKGTKLAMDSFDVEYGWETVLVVADDVANYEIGGKTTKDGKGLVSFKLVEDNGELADEVYYVNADIDGDKVADLEFGKFYNALFEIDADDELVDMIGAIEYEAKVLKNNDEVAEIADFMKNYTIVDKYNVKNLSKDTLYDDEIIVVEDATETVAIEWNNAATYAINWETGDILKKGTDGKYTTEWHYNEMYDLYFKWESGKDIITDYEGNDIEIAGIEIMSDKDLADLKAAIKASTVSKTADYNGYKLYTGAFDSAYAQLVAYDLDGDDMYDYAKYNTYKLGKYEGTVGDSAAGKCGSCDNLKSYKFSGNGFTNYYPIAGTCDHFKAGNDATYTITEVTAGYTGWVIYDVDNAANTIEIVKEIAAYGKNTDEDSYVATGIVRGLDASGKYVVIGNEKFSFDYDKLNGTYFPKAGDNAKKYVSEFFDSLFNQFVEYVLVDGKIVKINTKGASTTNYIVVENYYGVDSDGYIVVAGYTTDDLKYDTFRIGAYDGWKTGSGFFYNEAKLEAEFVKGNVYQITSVDTTEKNDNVYYVTTIGNADEGDIVPVNGHNLVKDVTVAVQDNYRITSGGKTETKRLADSQKYIILGGADEEFMPIYTFKGKIPDPNWTITGDLLVANTDLYIFCNVDYVEGFNSDTTKTGFVVLRDNFYKTVNFDGYNAEYYVYGATTYNVEAFNLLTGKTDDYAAATNLDLDKYEIYTTIDNTIVNDKARAWSGEDGFWTKAQVAYHDYEASKNDANGLDDPDYLFKSAAVASNDTIKDKAAVSKNFVSGMLGLTGKYEDLVGDLKVYELKLDTKGNVTKIDGFSWADDVAADAANVGVYVIYNAKTTGCVVYVDVNNYAKKDVTASDVKIPFANDVKVENNSFDEYKTEINGTLIADTVSKNGKVVKATVKAIDLAWGDPAAKDATDDTLRSILRNGFYFGRKGESLHEMWGTKVNGKLVYGTIVADTYDIKEEFKSDLAEDVYNALVGAVNEVKISDLAIVVEEGKPAQTVELSFTDSFGLTNVTWNFEIEIEIDATGKVVAEFVECSAVNTALEFDVQ